MTWLFGMCLKGSWGWGQFLAEQLIGGKASQSKEWLSEEEELKMFFIMLFSFVASNSLAGLHSKSHSWLQ